MKTLPILALLVVLSFPVVLAHGGGADGEIQEQVFHGTGPVIAGGFAEVDFEMRGNDSLDWSVTASRPVRVNIHQHQHVETATYAQHNDTQEASGTFVAPADGTYSLMVVGFSPEEADVEVELDGTFGVVGMIGLTEEETAPAPFLPLLVVLVGLMAVARRGRAGRANADILIGRPRLGRVGSRGRTSSERIE